MTTCTDHLDDGLLRVPEAARLLGLSRSMLYQLMDKGEMPYVKFGKARRINRQCLLEYVRRNVTGPTQVVPAVQN
jgi:excisionase family DNA binding protein